MYVNTEVGIPHSVQLSWISGRSGENRFEGSSLEQFRAAVLGQPGAGEGPGHAVLERLEHWASKAYASDPPKPSSQQTDGQNPTHS